ncbi:hypothetical protein PVK06_009102 [Gossypium arboreum]|uniref:Reverse transcriptase domain-containing protein n=1 Tax=Gossypium arboreum TaxID=29729 RepID=A0ABR0QM23_GOSAR|nr:hypothetical protein PVK06_009102 [Gossypium arboreum]
MDLRPLNSHKAGTGPNGLMGQLIGASVESYATDGPSSSRPLVDYLKNKEIQAIIAVGPTRTKADHNGFEAGSTHLHSTDSGLNFKTVEGGFNIKDNISIPNSVINSCFNPVFVVHEVNVTDESSMVSKSATLMSDLVELQVTDSSGGSDQNKHTAVSFKEKGPATGATKNQSMEKLMGGWLSLFPSLKVMIQVALILVRVKDLGFIGPSFTCKEVMDQSTSRRLANLEMEVRDELESVLNHEELLWRQKASDEAAKFFKKLYGEKPSAKSTPLNIFSLFKEQDIDFLKKPVLNDEINKALFDMAPLKAPGSDGFHAHFFQSQWDLLGGAVWFIAGRNISDNVIITQEVIHSMRRRKADRNSMAIKLDLEKAYDKISWDFIDVSLGAAGILEVLRKVIMDAISSSTMQILWNGVPSNSFKPVRGIRQGCPLSPYLFVLCMEWLGHLFRSEITNGVPLLHDRVTKSTLNFVVEKVRRKLQNWEARKLSFAGRVTLAQSVLLAIPNYFMQSLLVPKEVCDEIERIVRQFIWGSLAGHPKVALVGWETICQPRAHGGLGFRHLHDQNNSFLMKISFNLVSQKDALWVRVLRSKYGWKSQLPDSIHRSNCSHLWRSLSKDGSWNVDMLRIWLNDDMIRRIVSIPPPHSAGGEDRVIWGHPDQRVCLFLWIVVKQRLFTNLERVRRGIGHSSECPQCAHDTEDIMHVLHDFSTSKEVWKLVVPLEKQDSWAQHFEPFLIGTKAASSSSEIHHHSSDDWVQLFTDGAVARDSRNASAGGVVRDQDRNWILGFTHYLGRCSLMEAEL